MSFVELIAAEEEPEPPPSLLPHDCCLEPTIAADRRFAIHGSHASTLLARRWQCQGTVNPSRLLVPSLALLGSLCACGDAVPDQTSEVAPSARAPAPDAGLAPGCGDGVRSEDELCDGEDLGGASCSSLGFERGQLRCAADCMGLDDSGCSTCRDGRVTGDEVCDFHPTEPLVIDLPYCRELGDYDSGNVVCVECLDFDVSDCARCGDGVVGGAEACDGSVPEGLSCEALGYDGGELSCDAGCEVDIQGCGLGCPAAFREGDACDTPLMACPMNECRPCSADIWTIDRQSFCRCSPASNTWVCDPLDCYFFTCEAYELPNYYFDEACTVPTSRPAECR